MKKPLRVFCSYSHRDEELRREFAPYLGVLAQEGLAEPWYDVMIRPGDEWDDEIREKLDAAQLILLFISADFINSDYVNAVELPRAIELHDMQRARVVPILLRPTPLGGRFLFERLQMLPHSRQPVTAFAQRDIAWTEVTNALRELVVELTAEPARPLDARRVQLECRSLPNEIVCVFDHTAVIGRASACDIAVRQAPPVVSKRHARFFYDPAKNEFVIDDLASHNGTWVDGERVRMAPLRIGSVINLGGGIQFTYWRYDNGTPAGVLINSNGAEELSRYVLAPGKRVGLGTTMHDAVQLPLLADGRSIGTLATGDGLLFYEPADGRTRIRLRDGATIDGQALQLDVRILE